MHEGLWREATPFAQEASGSFTVLQRRVQDLDSVIHLRVFGEAHTPVGPGGLGILHSFAEEGAVVGSRVRSGSLLAPALSLLGVTRQLLVRLALALDALRAILGSCPLGLLSCTESAQDCTRAT